MTHIHFCLKGFELKISMYYVNHILLVILMLIGTFKNVFKILQIPCGGRTLDLIKYMNDEIGEF